MRRIKIIVATARGNVIGKDGTMPWKMPRIDRDHFVRETLGKTVIMGRKTYESLGAPLSGRRNIVMTRDASFDLDASSGLAVRSVDEALSACADERDVYVIGGAEIYALFMPIATDLIVTKLNLKVEGDRVFPAPRLGEWSLLRREDYEGLSISWSERVK